MPLTGARPLDDGRSKADDGRRKSDDGNCTVLLDVTKATKPLQLLRTQILQPLGVWLEPRRGGHFLPAVERLREPRDDVMVLCGDVGLVERILEEVIELELGT